MFAIRSLLLILVIPALPMSLFGQSLFVKPIKALGDPHFIGTATNPLQYSSNGPNLVEGRELNGAQGIAIDNNGGNSLIYISDTGNNRVLGYKYATQLVAGSKADIVIGQQDFFGTNAAGPGTAFSSGLNTPTGIVLDSNGNLYIADSGNNRILRFPRPFDQTNGQSPDMVIGQPNLTSGTTNPNEVKANTLHLVTNASYLGKSGLAMDSGGNLWIADIGNNRVLRYSSYVLKNGANSPDADVVVGQPDLVSSTALTSRTDKTLLRGPTGIGFDTAGRLWVGDSANRVLVYPIGVASNTAALRILGIPTGGTSGAPSEISFGLTGGNQFGFAFNGNTANVVSDLTNNRILIYDAFSTWPAEASQFSPSAKTLIGQASFGDIKANRGNPESASNSLSAPIDVAFGGNELYVADANNNRVLSFANSSFQVSGTASRVIGQLDFPFSAVNLIEGHEFNFAFASGYYGAVALDSSVVPARLYVADTFNHRILGFSNFAALRNGDFPDLVIGQPDFKRNQVNYPTNDPNKPNSASLYLPTGLAVDGVGNLYVADSGNSRVLRFPAPYAGAKAGAAADLVIGQSNFTSVVTDNSPRNLRKPVSIALTSDAANPGVPNKGYLLVADSSQNRVMFFPKPFSTGMSAEKVLGQASFVDSNTGRDLARFNSPRGVAVDQFDRVLVVDAGNNRISCFDRASSLTNLQGAFFAVTPTGGTTSGTGGLTSVSVSQDGDFWVSDLGTSTLFHFPSIDNLPGKNFASDASLPVLGPLSVFVDKFKNVVTADSLNRVLYFVPQVTVENSANYSTRALSPGTIAAVFPTVARNTLAADTQTFDSLPNPLPVTTTLADTQVLVNGTPSSVFYVSPTQINVPLSYNLPQSGSVDLQVIRKSTGQITGAAEVQMGAASPGLYTIGAYGYGQAIAVHFADGSLNSPTNAITRGQPLTLYLTGEGRVPNAPADGNVSSGPLPNPNLPVITLTSGTTTYTVPASAIGYSGIAPFLVGVWQLNLTIPQEAPSGNRVQIIVQQYGYSSLDPTNVANTTTTLAIK